MATTATPAPASTSTSTPAPMTTERKILITLALIIIIGGVLFGYSAFKNHDAEVKAAAQIKADEAIKAEKDKAMADRDAQLKQYQAAIASQAAKVSTASQAVQVIDHYLPAQTGAPAPQVVAQKSDLPSAITEKLPDAPSYVVETQSEAVDIAKGALQCASNTKALNTCQADLKDTQANLQTTNTEVSTLQTALKGGTRWQRFRAGLKHSLCGGAAVGAAFLGSKSSAQTAAISGGAVFTGCEVLVLR